MIFDRLEGKARRDEGTGEGTSNRSAKRKNKKQRHEDSLVAATDRKGSRKPIEGIPNHFKKMLKGLCPNHAFLIKHLLKDYGLMHKLLTGSATKGSRGRNLPPLRTTPRRRTMAF